MVKTCSDFLEIDLFYILWTSRCCKERPDSNKRETSCPSRLRAGGMAAPSMPFVHDGSFMAQSGFISTL